MYMCKKHLQNYDLLLSLNSLLECSIFISSENHCNNLRYTLHHVLKSKHLLQKLMTFLHDTATKFI